MQIKNEVLARIFASYLGAPIVIPSIADNDDWDGYFLQQVDKWGGVTIGHPEHGISVFEPKDGVKLVLSPLSSITDEHAIEVVKLDLQPLPNFEVLEIINRGNWTEINYRWVHPEHNNADGYSYSGVGFSHAWHQLRPIQVDYLRSVDYDCGYGAISSLIGAGIAITAPNPERSVATDGPSEKTKPATKN